MTQVPPIEEEEDLRSVFSSRLSSQLQDVLSLPCLFSTVSASPCREDPPSSPTPGPRGRACSPDPMSRSEQYSYKITCASTIENGYLLKITHVKHVN